MALARDIQQYLGLDSKLLVGGVVEYYEASIDGILTTPKDVYLDPLYTTPTSSVQPINALGMTVPIYLKYPYGMQMWSKDGALLATLGWVDSGSDSISSDIRQVENIAELRSLDSSLLENGDSVFVAGYFNGNDGGSSNFVWDATSSASDDAGLIIIPDDSVGLGRWKRVYDYIKPQYFGGISGTSAIDCAGALTAMNISSSKAPRFIPAGTYYILTEFVLSGDYVLIIDNNVKFDSTLELDCTLNVKALTCHCDSAMDSAFVTLFINNETVKHHWNYNINTPYSVATHTKNVLIEKHVTVNGLRDWSTKKTIVTGSITGLIGNLSELSIDIAECIAGGIKGDIAEWTFIQREIKASWFENNQFATAIAGGTHDIYIDNNITFVTLSATGQDNLRWIPAGGIINCGTTNAVHISNIVENDIALFSPEATYLPLLNQGIRLSTFGAISDSTDVAYVNNHKAISNAIKAVSTSTDNNRHRFVDGCGKSYRITGTITTGVFAPLGLKHMIVKNMGIEVDTTFAQTFVPGASDNGGLDNYILMNEGAITYKNCTFRGYDDGVSVYIGTVACRTQSLIGNPKTNFIDCDFISCNLLTLSLSNFTMRNVDFDGGQLYFGASLNGDTVHDIDIKNCSWLGYDGYADGIFIGSGLSLYDNKFIEIYDNRFENAVKRSTRASKVQFLAITSAIYYTIPAIESARLELIFPYISSTMDAGDQKRNFSRASVTLGSIHADTNQMCIEDLRLSKYQVISKDEVFFAFVYKADFTRVAQMVMFDVHVNSRDTLNEILELDT